MGEARKRMLIILGLGIACYGAWTSFLSIFSLIAESGGKSSELWLAMGVFWPLLELFGSWVWIIRHPDQYAISRSRRLGDGVIIGAVVASAPLTFLLGATLFDQLGGRVSWQLSVAVPGLITVIACWVARNLWSRASGSGSVLGL